MSITVSRFRPRCAYLLVRDDVARRIDDGEWKIGDKLTNEADLAREMNVSGGTMRKALDLLESEGRLSRRQGLGTFVLDPSQAKVQLSLDRVVATKVYKMLSAQQLAGRADDDLALVRADLHLKLQKLNGVADAAE